MVSWYAHQLKTCSCLTRFYYSVARYVSEDATASQCQNRYNRTLDPTLKRGVWSPEESERLRLAVAAYGKSWVEVSLLVPGRSSDQCREHWLERANPDLSKGKWTDEDDQALLDAVDAVGKNWKDVAEYLDNGRSENMVCITLIATLSTLTSVHSAA